MKDHAAFILRNEDKVLFVQRAATKRVLPNIWAFPSGTVEEGELVEATAIREAMEELGVEVVVEDTLAVTELPEMGVRIHFIICKVITGVPQIMQPEEIQTLAWMTMPEFFNTFSDEQIGHGLIWLRAHPEVWQKYFSI